MLTDADWPEPALLSYNKKSPTYFTKSKAAAAARRGASPALGLGASPPEPCGRPEYRAQPLPGRPRRPDPLCPASPPPRHSGPPGPGVDSAPPPPPPGRTKISIWDFPE
ncbi:FYVE and coiled-coil domain-containing protein 1 [Manis javanica]|nr:FYVE and coiled-coil domain-containing protein 1 [Manis javanica]